MSTFDTLRIRSKSLDHCSSTAVKQFEHGGISVSFGSYGAGGTTLGQFACVSDAQFDVSIEEVDGTPLYAKIADILRGKLPDAKKAARIKKFALRQLANHPEHIDRLIRHAYLVNDQGGVCPMPDAAPEKH